MKKVLNSFIIIIVLFSIFSCKKNPASFSQIEIVEPEIVYVARRDANRDWGVAVCINVMDANGNNNRELLSVTDGFVEDPCFSSNGDRIVFVMYSDTLGTAENIYTINYDGSELIQISNSLDSLSYYEPKFIPNSNLISYLVRLWDGTVHFQVRILNTESREQRIISDNTQSFSPIVTPDGQNLVYKQSDGNLIKYNIVTNSYSQLTNLDYVAHPQISLDGKKLYFVSEISHLLYDMYSIDINGQNLEKLTNRNDINSAYMRISPDETKILCKLLPSNAGFGIWLMNTDGTDLKIITDYYTWEGNPDFYPDSKKIITRRDGDINNDSNDHLYSVRIDGTDLKCLTQDLYYRNESPNFRYISE